MRSNALNFGTAAAADAALPATPASFKNDRLVIPEPISLLFIASFFFTNLPPERS
jgi:hypothetical protein